MWVWRLEFSNCGDERDGLSSLVGNYQPDSVKRFVFGPVETATPANCRKHKRPACP